MSTEDAAPVLAAQGQFLGTPSLCGCLGHSDSGSRRVGRPGMFMKLPTADCSLRTPKADPSRSWLCISCCTVADPDMMGTRVREPSKGTRSHKVPWKAMLAPCAGDAGPCSSHLGVLWGQEDRSVYTRSMLVRAGLPLGTGVGMARPLLPVCVGFYSVGFILIQYSEANRPGGHGPCKESLFLTDSRRKGPAHRASSGSTWPRGN